ncbi:hypothetical protein [Cellulosimicrobium cellulans]|uniref:hypothetical protein n=1 Tax=Cellulosimicrobium cellulans TaxID=1710 RepID=UPI00130D51CA|nr:hypothetical protein [Cellulosimicrobium cellulans]
MTGRLGDEVANALAVRLEHPGHAHVRLGRQRLAPSTRLLARSPPAGLLPVHRYRALPGAR